MPADSIPAAHSARTEMSAHPVSKSSFKKDYTIPRPSKRLISPEGAHATTAIAKTNGCRPACFRRYVDNGPDVPSRDKGQFRSLGQAHLRRPLRGACRAGSNSVLATLKSDFQSIPINRHHQIQLVRFVPEVDKPPR